MRGYRIPETKQCCSLVIVEQMEKFREKFVRGIRCGVGASVRDVEGKNDSATDVNWCVVLCQGLKGHAQERC